MLQSSLCVGILEKSTGARQRGLNTKRPTIVFFLGPTNPLPSSRIGDTVVVKRREMIGRTQTTLPWWLGGKGV